MSENNQNSTNSSKGSKQRLGRGLGSLLGGAASQGMEIESAQKPSPIKPASAPFNAPTINAAGIEAIIKSGESRTKDETKIEKPTIQFVDRVVEKIVEKIVEVPGPERLIEVLGPERIVEVMGPERIVEVPGPERIVEVVGPAADVPDTARIWTIPVERLAPNTQQPRQVFEDEPLKELAASIREKGIMQPITARRLNEREFEIIAGERRWRAAQMAGLKEVPVILKEVSEQDSLELAILENIQRADLNPIEESEAYDHLMKTYGLTQAQVADRLGKERSSVANALRLMALPPEVKLMIGGGELSSGHAKVLLGLESMADQISLAKEVIREKLSVRALEKKVAEKKTMGTGATVGTRPAMGLDVSSKLVEALAGELQKLIGTRVVIDYADRRGKLSVYFHSDEQLTEIVERMRRGWAKSNATQNSAATASSRV